MKKLFFSAIPICLVSFILFGISTAILGTKSRSYADNSAYVVPDDGGSNTSYIDETTERGEWTLNAAVRPAVTLRTSGVNAYVIQSGDDDIHMRVASNNGSYVHVNAYTYGDMLHIEVCPPNVIFDGTIDFGKIFWMDDIFHGSPDTEVIIAFPKLIYEALYIEHGSGTLMVDGFNSKYNDFDIGSGKFEFSKSEQFTADMFKVNVGSGSAVISNMQTERYDIDLGSGKYNFNGLSGYGEINMGSGNGSISYSRFAVDQDDGENNLLIGSGSLNLYFPDNEGCMLVTDIGSGSINLNAYGVEKKLTHSSDDEEIMLGESENSIFYYIDMGSGKVNIRNTSEYTMPTLFDGRPDLGKISEITGIFISTDGEAAFSSSFSSINADVIEQTGVITIPEESANASGSLSNVTVATTSVPEVPDAPSVPAI